MARDEVRNGHQRRATYFKLWYTKSQGAAYDFFVCPITSSKERNAVFKDSNILQYLFVCQTGIRHLRNCLAKPSYVLNGFTAIKTKIFTIKSYTDLTL